MIILFYYEIFCIEKHWILEKGKKYIYSCEYTKYTHLYVENWKLKFKVKKLVSIDESLSINKGIFF